MAEPKFTYTMEPGNNKGFIWLYKGYKKKTTEEIIYTYNDEELLDALKQNEKGAIITYHEDLEVLKEGKRLAKKLGLDFQHP